MHDIELDRSWRCVEVAASDAQTVVQLARISMSSTRSNWARLTVITRRNQHRLIFYLCLSGDFHLLGYLNMLWRARKCFSPRGRCMHSSKRGCASNSKLWVPSICYRGTSDAL